jgi:dihydroflavonol-4-reductase
MPLAPGLSLVTGATGFVGAAVARALLAAGLPVRVLARPGSDRRNLAGLDVEIAEGSLEDADSLSAAVVGCRYLFHVAADYRLWVPDKAAMFRANVDGTRALMLAALDAGVERIVYTSSVATLGLIAGGLADEATPSGLADMIGPYKQSKFAAEEAVNALVDERGLPAVIVNPSTPIGPGDVKPTPTGRIIVEAAKGRMPGYVDTGLNVVHVDDVAAGQLLAAECGIVGERYILGGENLTLKQILDKLGMISGLPSPTVKLPYFVAYLAGAVDQTISGSLLGREPRATIETVRMGKKKMWASSEKAERELGWKIMPADAALRRAVEWFQAHGYA